MLQKCFRPASDKTLKYLKDRAWSGHSGITKLFQATAPHSFKKRLYLQIEVFWKKTKPKQNEP